MFPFTFLRTPHFVFPLTTLQTVSVVIWLTTEVKRSNTQKWYRRKQLNIVTTIWIKIRVVTVWRKTRDTDSNGPRKCSFLMPQIEKCLRTDGTSTRRRTESIAR
jgi:hypothetical protein